MDEKPELKTERLLLRSFSLEDADDVFAYAADGEWARYVPIPYPYQRSDAEEFVARSVLTPWDVHPVFAIVLDDRVVGSVDLSIERDDLTASLAYAIGRDYWGRGLMPEATHSVIDWGFRCHGLARVWTTADARNLRSLRVLEKLGMTREGLLRSHRVLRDERVDRVYYGLLRQEWERR